MKDDNLINQAKDLVDFIYKSPTVFQTVSNIKSILKQNNFKELYEYDKWNLEKSGKYFVSKNDTAIISFVIGDGNLFCDGFKLIGTHTDSPSLKLKPNSIINVENNYIKVNVETYGTPIYSTWFDRPLSLAGKVITRENNIFKPKEHIINIRKPLMIIPNLALHFNKEINSGYKYNVQLDMLPLFSLNDNNINNNNDYLLNILSNEIGTDKFNILDFDLYLYEYEKGRILGMNDEFISSSRLDDLWMVYAALEGFIDSSKTSSTKVLVCLDNEEIGSATAQGADSLLLRNILERIVYSLEGSNEDVFRTLSNSLIISADLAHGVHPNYLDKHDPTNHAILGKGPVIKYSANQKYTTSAFSSSIFCQLCEKYNIPIQKFVNRSDITGGSTIAKFLSSNLGAHVIDVGTSLLAMHSIRELGSVLDNYYIIKVFREFYSN